MNKVILLAGWCLSVLTMIVFSVSPAWTSTVSRGALPLTAVYNKTVYELVSFERLFFNYQPPVDVEHPDGNVTKAAKAPKAIPPEIKALNGKKVAIKGFVIPLTNSGNSFSEFLFADAFVSCLFCQMLGYDQWIMATVIGAKGVKIADEQLEEPAIIYGTFEVGEEFQDGHFTTLYRMKVDGVKLTSKRLFGLF